MKVVAQCAGCDKLYRVAEKYAGRTIRCKKCGEGFKVPKLEESLEESGLEEDIEPEPEPPKAAKRRPTGKLAKKKATGKFKGAKKKATGKMAALAKKDAEENEGEPAKATARGKGTARTRAAKKREDEPPAKKSTGKLAKKKATGKFKGAKKKATGKMAALAKKDEAPNEGKRGKGTASLKAAKKGKTSAATRALKKDSRGAKTRDKKDTGRRKKTTGAFKRDKSGIRRKSGGARRAGRDKDEAGRSPRRGKGPLLIAAGAATLLIVAVVLFLALPRGPGAQAKQFYDEVKVNLDDADQKRLDGNFLLAGQTYAAILKTTGSTAFPLETEYVPDLKERLALAKDRLKEAKELEAIYNKLENGEGQREALSKVSHDDAAIRLAAVTLLDRGAREEPEFAKALAMLATDKDERVAKKARGVLRGIGGKAALPYLLEALDTPGSAQDDALAKIAGINDPAALTALHKCLTILDPAKNSEDATLAGQVIDSLGSIADKSSVKPLEDFAKKCSGELKDAVDSAIESCKEGG